MLDDPTGLPAGLPAPLDDGGARHLPGSVVPSLALPSTAGGRIDLAGDGPTLVFAFPWAGRPGEPLPAPDWDLIPGARGCTPEMCGVRDHHARLAACGVRIVGLSVQTPALQSEVVARLGLPYPLLSDADRRLVEAMRLPTLQAGGRTLIRRLTMLVRDGAVERVWYPVFPPDGHAAAVLADLGA